MSQGAESVKGEGRAWSRGRDDGRSWMVRLRCRATRGNGETRSTWKGGSLRFREGRKSGDDASDDELSATWTQSRWLDLSLPLRPRRMSVLVSRGDDSRAAEWSWYGQAGRA